MIDKKVLLVDDDDSIRWVLNELLEDMGLAVTQANSAESALSLLQQMSFDLVISDVRMSGKSGMALLEFCQVDQPDLPIVIMTAHSDLESAVGAYQSGAYEYLPKPFDLDEVTAIVKRALAPKQMADKKNQAEHKSQKYSIIGESPAMQDLYRAIGRLSNSQATVLLHGESGTGKELVANALHQHSPRKDQPFIALNMAAIPKDLIESELFGHEKGAFTGASGRYQGRFEQANGGTLFLDEIGDMPLDTQTRLLRVLSEGAFYRIGSTQPTTVDVRIIAATHQNLLEKVDKGEFREDLYHRLNVIPLHLPPLRNRSTDVPILIDFFLEKIALEINEPKKAITPDALYELENFQWPGNVRQLENVCRWLMVMTNGQVITSADLPQELHQKKSSQEPSLRWQNIMTTQVINEFQKGNQESFIHAQNIFEQSLIKAALECTLGKKAEASKILGWGRNTLTRKMKS